MSQMSFKSLKELVLNVDEQTYRDYDALSYSLLAKYEKGGFSSIRSLKEPVEGEAILFGSMVDTLITEGREAFDRKFVVASYQIPTDSVKEVVDTLFENYNIVPNFENYANTTILRACDDCNFQMNWKPETRLKKVKELGAEYFNSLKILEGKKLVSSQLYKDVITTVEALKHSENTAKYLGETSEDTEFLYQCKFVETLSDIPFKCMFDLLIVSHENKVIVPIDLKTSGLYEYEFPKKFLENRYDIQSRLYTKILQSIVSKDDYFKDFNILNFRFIVINKISLNPLIFEDELCKVPDTIKFTLKDNKKIILRHPIDIGKELKHYLDTNAVVPDFINNNGTTKIYNQLIKM